MIRLRANDAPTPLLISDSEMRIIRSNVQDDGVITSSASLSWPAILDFDKDGTLDFIFLNYDKNRLEAKNDNGAFLWGFPLDAPQGHTFLGTPLLVDLNDSGEPELLIPAADSLSYIIHGYDSRLNRLEGFPLYIGSLSGGNTYPIQPLFRENRLYAISPSGDLKVWEFENAGQVFWGSVYGDDPSNKIIAEAPQDGDAPSGFDLLNSEETYNWPNPATTETWIRYQTNGQADITITVANMSGTKLFEQQLQSRGGSSEEVLVDTSGWGSGVYFARVRATQGGREETRLIKIAVIR